MSDQAPSTIDIKGLEIFAAGTFNGDEYSEKDLDAMVDAFNRVQFKPTVKAGHADGQEDAEQARRIFGAPALGYASKIYRQGKKLLADVTKVPRRFADLVKKGAYSRISSEIYWNYAEEGKKFPRVLKSIAFLGADIPALTNLKEIELLYNRNDNGLLYRYEENGAQEIRLYDFHVVNRYEDMSIQMDGDMHCVMWGDEKKKCFDNRPDAEAYLEECKKKGNDYSDLQRAAQPNSIPITLIAKFCDNCGEKARKFGITELKFDLDAVPLDVIDFVLRRYKDKEGGNWASKDPGMFTSCMEDSEMQDRYADEETRAKVCASLHNKITGEWPGAHRSESSNKQENRSYKKSGGKDMTPEELEEQMNAKVEQLRAELKKEYEREAEYRVHKAREDAKAEAEKESDELREEIRKLQTEKRSERIENWIKRMKADGKVSPAEESKVRALREWITDEETGLKWFSLKDGKTQEHQDSAAAIFESLFESRSSQFKTFSKDGNDEDEGQELEDPGQEVDRRARVLQSKQKQAGSGNVMSYSQACAQVLKADRNLAARYNNMERH